MLKQGYCLTTFKDKVSLTVTSVLYKYSKCFFLRSYLQSITSAESILQHFASGWKIVTLVHRKIVFFALQNQHALFSVT